MGAADKEFMPAEDYGRTLQGLGVNLLVRDVPRSVAFAREVLGASVAYADKDFAVLRYANGPTRAEWMLHSDGTYHSNPLLGLIGDAQVRGVGAEIRLYHCDPDAAAARAKAHGHHVLAEAADKPHGLREAYILDPDGYCWVPAVHKKARTVAQAEGTHSDEPRGGRPSNMKQSRNKPPLPSRERDV